MGEYALEMLGICKSFPGVHALKDVNLRVKKGEVHALIGENGAGKSTLMKILSGVYKEDSGEIIIDGKSTKMQNPQDAIEKGISIIYQELNLVPKLGAIQNVMLGHEKSRYGWLDFKAEEKEAKRWLDYVSCGKLPNYKAPVEFYSVAQQQMVEIAKALSLQAKIIVMDEPTDTLTENDMLTLFAIINQLKKDGITVIYISHRLEEIFMVCDCVTVLRDGMYIDSRETSEVDRYWLIQSMIGREMANTFPPRNRSYTSEVVLDVKDLNSKRFKNINFKLKKGEILGFSGLVGSGRTEVMRAIFGADHYNSGKINFKGLEAVYKHPKAAIEAGIGFATEDRKGQGLFLGLSIKSNVSIASIKKISRKGFIQKRKEGELIKKYIDELRIATTDHNKLCKHLSGGNQQKVVLAKWMATGSSILILDEPTRGIDVGAKYEIYLLMDKLVKSGVSIIMVSSEMPELIAMSDRIIVMSEGAITGELTHEEANETLVMTYATRSNNSF
jgi:ABC-type sugar transport system, ATPase component